MNSKLSLSSKDLNVLGTPLQNCSCNPLTGWFRDGFCHFDKNDHGNHTMCCIMDNNFLNYSKSQGNDLITSMPQYSFPGLKEVINGAFASTDGNKPWKTVLHH